MIDRALFFKTRTMSLFLFENKNVQKVTETTFAQEKISERGDIQAMLKHNINLISDDLLVISEEFSSWSESSRRIDLLAIDKEANVVVIELKRTEDGGHMELQSIRYAAMVSSMTFNQAIDIYESYLDAENIDINAREKLLEFLEWEEENETDFGNAVKIILVSANFSKEITTSVLWLNTQGLDIKCIRLRPFNLDGKILLNIEQILPLPEANDYQIEIRKKEQAKRTSTKRNKSMSEILELLKKSSTTDEYDVALKILEIFKNIGDSVYTTSNGFGIALEEEGKTKYPMKVNHYGSVELQFKYMSWYPPFSVEQLRIEYINKLNQIEGVNISLGKNKGMPKISLNLLTIKSEFIKFESHLKWVVETIRNHKI